MDIEKGKKALKILKKALLQIQLWSGQGRSNTNLIDEMKKTIDELEKEVYG